MKRAKYSIDMLLPLTSLSLDDVECIKEEHDSDEKCQDEINKQGSEAYGEDLNRLEEIAIDDLAFAKSII